MKLLIVFLATLIGVLGANKSGYQVVRIPITEKRIKEFLRPYHGEVGFDFWTLPQVGKEAEVMVSPENIKGFLSSLKRHRIPHRIHMEDVEKWLSEQRRTYASRIGSNKAISFNQYYDHSEINDYLDELQQTYPDLVSVVSIGQSFEGRDMRVIKISSGNGTKPGFFIDAGIHAREWIAPASALYIINQLVENTAANSDLVDNIDWYILPVFNPDGYDYTFTTDRSWRKTRSTTASLLCDGVDANRNFDFHWMEGGASSQPCSETYAGPEAFSEVESRNVRDYILANSDNIQLYLSFHSSAQMLFYPWAYTSTLPSDVQDLIPLAEDVASAIYQAGGTDYAVGTAPDLLYVASGGTFDWAKGGAGIKYAYTLEVTGLGYSFYLPESLIQSVVSDVYEGIRVFGNFLIQNGKKVSN